MRRSSQKPLVKLNACCTERFNFFKANYLNTNNSIFGHVSYWVAKREWQCRGTQHWHIALWIPDASHVARVQSSITCVIPDQATFPELYVDPTSALFFTNLCITLRKCHNHLCNRNPGGCRDSKSRFGSTPQCQNHFPNDIVKTTAVYDPQKGAYKYPCLSPQDMFCVQYHPQILAMWQCHSHIMAITKDDWLSYILSYIFKADSFGHVEIHSSPDDAFGLNSDVSLGTVRTIASMTHVKVTSCNEAASFLAQESVVQRKQNVGFLKLSTPLPSSVKWYKQVQNWRFVDAKFFDRPTHPDTNCITMVDYFSKFKLELPNKKRDAQPTFVGIDIAGYSVHKAYDKNVEGSLYIRVAYHDFYNAKAGETFFYTELLRRTITARSRDELLSHDNLSREFIEECVLQKIFESDEDLIAFTKASVMALWKPATTSYCGIYKHRNPIASCIHRRHSLQTLRDDVQASPPTDLDRLFNKVNRRFAVPNYERRVVSCSRAHY